MRKGGEVDSGEILCMEITRTKVDNNELIMTVVANIH